MTPSALTVPATVRTVDGVDVVMHDLGGTGTPLLVSHATGFHGRCYLPLAHELAATRHCVAFDYRGHGDTPRPDEPVDWQRYANDAEATAEWMAEATGGPIDAFGHSMGGACILIAAHRRPELFRRIVAYEPVVFPPEFREVDSSSDPLAQSALRRRATFDSYEAAIANFASKPPLMAFRPDALEQYVRHGFRANPDGSVTLKCAPEVESATFRMGTSHDTWDRLASIPTDVVIVSGRVDSYQPSSLAAAIAEHLPHGRLLQRSDLDHFGPMTHPHDLAAMLEVLFG